MLTHTTMKTKPTGQSLLMAVFDLRLRYSENTVVKCYLD